MEFTKEGQQYIKSLLSPFRFRLGMLKKLPSIFFWGAKVQYIDNKRCEIFIPFKWTTQNPFRSIYFAAQCGVGEISTGLMLDALLRGRGSWSMLVIDFNAKFTKKADKDVVYICEEGKKLSEAITMAEKSGKPQVIEVKTSGYMANDVKVSDMIITWSIKKRVERT